MKLIASYSQKPRRALLLIVSIVLFACAALFIWARTEFGLSFAEMPALQRRNIEFSAQQERWLFWGMIGLILLLGLVLWLRWLKSYTRPAKIELYADRVLIYGDRILRDHVVILFADVRTLKLLNLRPGPALMIKMSLLNSAILHRHAFVDHATFDAFVSKLSELSHLPIQGRA